MESFNDFYDYDIESPRSSEIKTAAIENSIRNSLLVNNEVSKNYIINNFCLKILFGVLVLGIISTVILIIMKKLP
jgi:hypothetical protein